nr:hypothetical protein [Tanacetum cinerariifolium]
MTRIKMKALLLDQTEGLKKRKTSKDVEPTIGLKNKDSTSSTPKGTKSQPKSSRKTVQSEELEFKVGDTDLPQDQEGNLGKTLQKGPTQNWLMTLAAFPSTDKSLKSFKGTRSKYAKLEYDFEECYKALSEKLNWENPKGGDYPFDLIKPLPLFKTKAAHYDLTGIKDMVLNIWSIVKVSLDRYAKWGISYWRAQRKTFYAYAHGLESTHDMYSTKCILAETRVDIIKKHRPDTVRPDLQKMHPYTLYQDPQGFIYVDSLERNRHHQEYPHDVPAKEKMEFIGKEKSSLHDQGNQQAAEGKKDDAELGKFYWWQTL